MDLQLLICGYCSLEVTYVHDRVFIHPWFGDTSTIHNTPYTFGTTKRKEQDIYFLLYVVWVSNADVIVRKMALLLCICSVEDQKETQCKCNNVYLVSCCICLHLLCIVRSHIRIIVKIIYLFILTTYFHMIIPFSGGVFANVTRKYSQHTVLSLQ
jgi:hypothetical protein